MDIYQNRLIGTVSYSVEEEISIEQRPTEELGVVRWVVYLGNEVCLDTDSESEALELAHRIHHQGAPNAFKRREFEKEAHIVERVA